MTFPLQIEMPSVVTPDTQILVIDIDGDGTNEVIMLDGNLGQLSVCHQFAYNTITLNQISSSWSSTQPLWSDSTLRWITVWGVPPGGVPVTPNAAFGAWVVSPGDVIMAADMDGDGTDELFIYNLTTLNWGVLDWQSNGLQTICNQPIAPNGEGGGPISNLNAVTWQGSVNDQYFVVPNLNGILSNIAANADGILLYNSQTFSMGMISYAAGTFSQWWSNTGNSLPGGWGLNQAKSPHPATNKFYPGFFATKGVPSIVVFNPSDQYIGLLKWSNGAWTCQPAQGGTVGGWSFGWTDEIQAVDLFGDGTTDLFIYSAAAEGTTDIGILQWQNGSFQCKAINGGTFGTAPYQWTTGHKDSYFCLSGQDFNSGMIYAFSPTSAKVGLLYFTAINVWEGTWQIAVKWSGSTLSGNTGWPVSAGDTFFAGAAWDSATPDLITLSNQGPSGSQVLMLGGAGWNGTTIIYDGTAVQLVSSQTVPVPAWSPAGLANNAPHTPFPVPPFPTTDQQSIYAYLSQQYPVPGVPNNSPTSDVRSLYSVAANSGSWDNYRLGLEKAPSPSQIPANWTTPPQNNNWTNLDWTTVMGIITNECQQIDPVFTMSGELLTLGKTLHTYQLQDFVTVKGNIMQASHSSGAAQLNYWLGQIFVTGWWAFAANEGSIFQGAPAAAASFGVFASIVASQVGSGVAYNSTQQQSIDWGDGEQQIQGTTSTSNFSNSLNLNAILTDPVKMNIFSGLCGNEWQLNLTPTSTMIAAFQLVDRLWMYQQWIPFYFTIQVYGPGTSLPSSGATYTLNNIGYVLIDQYGPIPQSQFTATLLYSDLFSTIGASEEQFFLGIGPWARIPRQIMT